MNQHVMSSPFDQDSLADLKESTVEIRLRRAGPAAAQIGMWEWDPVSGDNYLSAELHEMFGTRPDDPERTALWASRVHPQDLPMVQAHMQQGLHSGTMQFEYRYQHPERGLRWF